MGTLTTDRLIQHTPIEFFKEVDKVVASFSKKKRKRDQDDIDETLKVWKQLREAVREYGSRYKLDLGTCSWPGTTLKDIEGLDMVKPTSYRKTPTEYKLYSSVYTLLRSVTQKETPDTKHDKEGAKAHGTKKGRTVGPTQPPEIKEETEATPPKEPPNKLKSLVELILQITKNGAESDKMPGKKTERPSVATVV